MAARADVRSVERIRELRSAVIVFMETVRNALAAADTDAYRRLRWVEEEAPAHWKGELKKRQAAFAEARVVLYRKQLGPVKDQQPHTEARFAYDRAKRRVEEAEEKLREAERWAQRIERAMAAMRGGVSPLSSFNDSQLPRAVARLDAFIESIEAYLGTAMSESHQLEDAPDDGWSARRGRAGDPGEREERTSDKSGRQSSDAPIQPESERGPI